MARTRTRTRPAAPALLALLQAACAPGRASGADAPGAWLAGLEATHYWDCNGQGCDASVLDPFIEQRFVSAPEYAPVDPADFGGSLYGESLWLTGAASDALAAQLGQDDGCCGADAHSGGCGRCLLVRNPGAENPSWTAVVMKKSRCPPDSPGCEHPRVHLDIAAPGYDNVTVSLANICGKTGFRTYITAAESGVCAGTHGGCQCEGMPNGTDETQQLYRGCRLFGAWGWRRGDPTLEWQPVECPPKFVERIQAAFTVTGVARKRRWHAWPWVAAAVAIVLLALGGCLINRVLDDRRERKAQERRRKKKQDREKERLRGRNFGGQGGRSSSSSEASSSSSSDSDVS